MTDTEKLEMLKALLGDTEDSENTLSTYLTLAGKKIINKVYPFDDTKTEVPARYETLQVEIAAYLLNKRGAEGETQHTENGVNRSYASADVPDDMLKSVIPHIGVPQ